MDNKVLLCAIAKQENLYIREWVEYHLKLGFDHITIYDNNEPDGEKITDITADYKNVNVINFRGRHQKSCETQVAAYNMCYKGACNYDWVMFMDIDEFLWFRDYDNIKSFLEQNWVKKANVIRFHWKCYSDNGKLTYEDLPVMERFTEECKEKSVNYHMKQLYRTKLGTLRIVNVHYTNHVNNIYYPDGKPAPYITTTRDKNVHDELAHVKHYVTKSLEEYVKIKYARRGVGSSKTRLNIDFYFKYNDKTDEKLDYYKKLINEMQGGETAEIKTKTMPYIPEEGYPEPKKEFEPNAYYENKVCPGAPKKTEVKKVVKPNTRHRGKVIPLVKKTESKATYPSVKPNNGVSVCISAYQSQDYIEECLDSVYTQTWFNDHSNWEILLGIDGCLETLKKVKTIMHKYKNLRVFVMDDNVGTYITCNTIMSNAKYSHLIRFDSDDIMLPNMVSDIMEVAFGDGKPDVVKYRCITFTDDRIIDSNRYLEGSICIRKDKFTEYGGYMPWRCAGDSELKKRLGNVLRFHYIDRPLCKVRRGNNHSLTLDSNTDLKSEYRKRNKEYIDTKSASTPKIEYTTTSCSELTFNKIAVSFTTWRERDKFVPRMLDNFVKQTHKPDKIILWLSEDEYGGRNIPTHIKKYVDSKIIDVEWVKENIYSHKRYESLKKYKGWVNIFIDDDILYDTTYVEELYTSSIDYPNSVICYISNRMKYDKNGRKFLPITDNPSTANYYLSGMACFPPYVFPMESFEHTELRDEISTKSDDCWVSAWLLKKGISIYAVHGREKKWENIDEAQYCGNWNENKVLVDGVMKKTRMFFDVCKAIDIYKQVSEYYGFEI